MQSSGKAISGNAQSNRSGQIDKGSDGAKESSIKKKRDKKLQDKIESKAAGIFSFNRPTQVT